MHTLQVYLAVSAETAAAYAKKGLKTGSYLAAVRSRYLFQTWVHHFGNAQMRKKVELVRGIKGVIHYCCTCHNSDRMFFYFCFRDQNDTCALLTSIYTRNYSQELHHEWKQLHRNHHQPGNGDDPIEPEHVLLSTQKIIMMIEIAGSLMRRSNNRLDDEVMAFARRFVIDEDCGGWTGYLARLCGIASQQDINNRREEEEGKYRDCYYRKLGVQSSQKGWQGTAWEKYGHPANTAKFGCERYWEFGERSRASRTCLPKPSSWRPPSSSTVAPQTSSAAPTPMTAQPTVHNPSPGFSTHDATSASASTAIETEDGSIPEPSMLSSWQLTN